MRHLRFSGSVLAALLIAVAICSPQTARAQACVNAVQNGNFENHTVGTFVWANWTSTSIRYGNTPTAQAEMCETSICGGINPPHQGSNWVWFGEWSGPGNEVGTVQQTGISFPAGTTRILSFYLRLGQTNGPALDDTLTVKIDGTTVATFTEAEGAGGYIRRDINLIPFGFSTGGSHTLLFTYTMPDPGSSGHIVRWLLDDISIVNCTTASDGALSGHIINPDGSPLAGAVVRLGGDASRMTMTDATGKYYFGELETTGVYNVTPSFVNHHFSPASRSVSLIGNQVEAGFTALSDGIPRENAIDSVEYFVRQQYLDFLGREPDEEGLNFWVNNIQSCGDDSDCKARKRIDTSAAFFFSIESQQTGFLVYRAFQSAFGDLPGQPVPINRGEFAADSAKLRNGLIVKKAGWEALLENNKRAYMEEFVQRTRFVEAYPTTMSPAQFVDQLFSTAGVSPADSGRAAVIEEFGSATNSADTAARGRALRRVAENSELVNKEFNEAFVQMQYLGYLQRDANTGPNTDFSGFNFWLSKLNSFNGDYRAAEMVKAFLVSDEYRGRFR